MKPIQDWRADAQYFDFNGHRMAYWTTRKADPAKPWLLLIHGFPTSSWDWTALWGELETHFNLAAADMLGFGLSAKPADSLYLLTEQADLQEALLVHLRVKAAHLFVHDYGNSVGQELLARHNECSLGFSIRSLCFLNGGLFPEQHRALPVQKFAISPFGFLLQFMFSRKRLRASFDEIFGPDSKASDEEIDGHWELLAVNNGHKVIHKLLQYIPQRREHRERWVGALQKASVPLFLIDGGVDPVSGKHMHDYYRDIVPNPDTALLEDIGHYPHTEAPARVRDAFMDFHKRIGTSNQ